MIKILSSGKYTVIVESPTDQYNDYIYETNVKPTWSSVKKSCCSRILKEIGRLNNRTKSLTKKDWEQAFTYMETKELKKKSKERPKKKLKEKKERRIEQLKLEYK